MRIGLRAIWSLGIVLVIMALALFLPAGSFKWIHGWLFLGSFTFLLALSYGYLARVNPELVAARSKIQSGTKSWDRVVFTVLELALVAILIVAGFDDGRFHWTPLPTWVVVLGYVLNCFGWATFVWAMRVNKFAEATVRIQTDRAHKVIDTGPYAFVRHPFYVGAIVWLLALPLSLASFWALIPTAVAIFVMLVRTKLEDRTLQNELAGYRDYARRVRYRLVPGVW
jgi:protein-S-isoprenylcysteine O-methyltransferase Ste14